MSLKMSDKLDTDVEVREGTNTMTLIKQSLSV